jgi:hypothetical protein
MVRDMSRGGCSGQVLVIAVLIVSLVLLSTQIYIFEVGRSLEGSHSASVNDFVLAIKLGSEHVVAGSLANISRGGDNAVLQSNLQSWASFLGGFYQLGRPVLNYTFRNSESYVNSTRVSWGAEGFGITSAYVDFNFSLRDGQVDVQLPFALNVSSSLFMEGVCRTLQGDMMQVNVTCHVLNEGVPALAGSITVLYEKSGVWLRADGKDSYSFADYGNGTYLIIFEQEYLPSETVNVSAQVYDLRSVYVQANTTCNEAA